MKMQGTAHRRQVWRERAPTSFESVFEGEGVVDLEALLSAAGKATLVLVEANIQNLVLVIHYFS